MKRGLSIRYKFLLVTTALLVFCVTVYLFMATQVFRKDKKELVYDLNRSLVTNLASDLDSVFASATDKMRLAAYFFYARDERNLAILRELLAASQDIVYVGGSEGFDKMSKRFFQSQNFVETYALPEDFFETVLNEQKPVPFARLQAEGEAIWNASIGNDGPPLIGYGKSVVLEGADGKPSAHYAVVAFLRADRVLKALRQVRLNQAMITNQSGEVLAHPDAQVLIQGDDPSVKELITKAQSNPVKSSVMPYMEGGQEFLGAYARAANNRLLVLSRVSSRSAFAVVNQFLARSGLVALMVLNLAFIAAILFSRSLTRPLQALMDGMEKVGEGELSTQIEVRSRDEIAALAKSFNGMIREIKNSREALEEINRELENKVRERTQQLEKQNQAVKSAQENLLKTTRLAAVGEIAGRAAHEVLNPLTTILARLERLQARLGQTNGAELNLLRDMVLSWRKDFSAGGFDQLVKAWKAPSQINVKATLWDEDLENIEAVQKQLGEELARVTQDADFLHREAQRIGRIVQAMRGLSIVESAKERHDLAKLCEDAVNIMNDLASQHNTQIILDCAVKPAWTILDQDEFLQSLTNMVRNSIQAIRERQNFQPQHAGRVELHLVAAGNQWQLRVRDNGAGIKPEDQKKLFENQFSTKPRSEGTGLGLNISRRFIRGAGGDIVLEHSKEGQETCFVVTLPIADVANNRGVA
ncbi:MAG: ATP-binding protein [Bdellovibrionales bacterium]